MESGEKLSARRRRPPTLCKRTNMASSAVDRLLEFANGIIDETADNVMSRRPVVVVVVVVVKRACIRERPLIDAPVGDCVGVRGEVVSTVSHARRMHGNATLFLADRARLSSVLMRRLAAGGAAGKKSSCEREFFSHRTGADVTDRPSDAHPYKSERASSILYKQVTMALRHMTSS